MNAKEFWAGTVWTESDHPIGRSKRSRESFLTSLSGSHAGVRSISSQTVSPSGPCGVGLTRDGLAWVERATSVSECPPVPVDTTTDWLQWIDQPLFDHELTALRTCVNRQQPFGTADWQAVIATTLGLESTLRQRGRPRKSSEK